MRATLALPSELTIYTVSELRQQWLSWMAEDHEHTCCVDAAAVDQVDAAGVQLLLSLSHTLTRQGQPWQVRDASAPLREACAALGLADRLLASSAGGAR